MVKGNCMKEIKQLKRKHMRESTAAKKKKIHSGAQAAFASRQLDNTHRVKVERGREAASPLRGEEEGGWGLPSRAAADANTARRLFPMHTLTCTHTAITPPPSPAPAFK